MDVIIRPGHKPYRLKRGSPDPTLEEIEYRAAEIRAEWTPAETMRRLRSDMRPTYIRCDQVREEMDSADYDAHIDSQWSQEFPNDDFDLPAD